VGVNSKARRAAKRRKQRASANTRGHAPSSPRAGAGNDDDRRDGREQVDVRRLLSDTLRQVRIAQRIAARRAREFLAGEHAGAIAAELDVLLRELTRSVMQLNWTSADLAEITRRRLSARHARAVSALVAANGERGMPDLTSVVGMQAALEIAALWETLPPIAALNRPTAGAGPSTEEGASSAILAKVRALLAKAESTEFPAEAEALSAKAQELITTYALDRYAAQLDGTPAELGMTVRRLWIDPPYVEPKALLVDAVAGANHCSAVLSVSLGFVTLVGQTADVELTELLVTSLQVQADRAMLRLARLGEGTADSRSRSFRRSFLVSYASRIRERLHQAVDEARAASGLSTELVPVMSRSDERVREVTAELFPEVTMRRTTISNREGWVAGRAAADLARLDVRDQLGEQAAS
jgi:hypothetical protein